MSESEGVERERERERGWRGGGGRGGSFVACLSIFGIDHVPLSRRSRGGERREIGREGGYSIGDMHSISGMAVFV